MKAAALVAVIAVVIAAASHHAAQPASPAHGPVAPSCAGTANIPGISGSKMQHHK